MTQEPLPVICTESIAEPESVPCSETEHLSEVEPRTQDKEAELLADNQSGAKISPGEDCNGSDVDAGTSAATEMETEVPPPNYWNYEISQNFKPNYLAITPPPVQEQAGKRLNFFKGCKWAPDGSCLMSNGDDDVLRLYNVPEALYAVQDWSSYQPEGDKEVQRIDSVLEVKEGGQVYDYCWYPRMSSWDPVTCCFLTTTADAPVHLWDAGSTGKLRASYLAYDHLDQVVAARSVSFDPTGESIICGFDTVIRTFNITRPGRECVERKLKHLEMSELSQPGIVSCIAVNPFLPSLMAVGSYLKTVGLYHDDGSVLCILQGHLGGVTHLQFSPDGSKLFSGGRKDSRLICWDLRSMGEAYTIYDRVVETNQRIYFDLTPNGKYLLTGETKGRVKIWDVNSADGSELLTSFQANEDCVNGVSVNPFIPLLATCSGQRHYSKSVHFSDDDDSDSESAQVQGEERDLRLWKLC